MAKVRDPNGGAQARENNFDGGDSRAARIIALHTSMESDALNFRTRWQDCANYIQPRKGNILTILSPGAPQTILLWDTTAEQALLTFAAGLVSFLTPPTERWFRLEPESDKAPAAFKDWLNDCSERLAQELAVSNFYEVWHEDCLDGGCFGSSLLRVDDYPEEQESVLNFVNIPVGTFYWREDNRGRIGTITRGWKWTADQAAEEFGVEALTPQLRKAYESTDVATSGQKFNFIELVRRRRKEDVVDGLTLDKHRPWECVYVCQEDQAVIHEQGYYENPYAGLRLMRSNNEVYGRGPGTQAMPNIKEANRIKEDRAVIRERMGRPPWIMPDDTAYQPDNRPDGVTFWDASKGEQYKPQQVQLHNNVPEVSDELNEERAMIRDYFFNDMFKLLTSDEEMQREKTAYEVSQMVQERLILFSPIFGRITQEKLNPMLYRAFAVMLRAGRFKPIPMGIDIRKAQFKVTYVSKIALAIKAIQNQAFAMALQLIQSLMAIDPSVRYLVKTLEGARQVLSNGGLPAAWVRDDDEIQQLQQRDQDAQQQLELAQAGLAGSQTVKNLGPQVQAAAGKAISAAAPTGAPRRGPAMAAA